jgi:prepilin-type processing-associated H-X9-DG protein
MWPIRRALTLIEILVIIFIIGLLIAITVPATMQVRESARRTQCSNNLRQIGLAINSYHSDHSMFPPGMAPGGYSFLVAILPYGDEATLFNHVNFSRLDAIQNLSADTGVTVRTRHVGLYLCPSDPLSTSAWGHVGSASNYAGNSGTGALKYGCNGFFRLLANDVLFDSGPLRARDFTDGLGSTAAVSEVLVSDFAPSEFRSIWNVQPYLTSLDDFSQACQDHSITGFFETFRGRPWTHGDLGVTRYNHVLSPNQKSCMNSGRIQLGIYTPASLHPGSVNVLFGDGRTTSISSSVDTQIWRSIGSRNGSEPNSRFF